MEKRKKMCRKLSEQKEPDDGKNQRKITFNESGINNMFNWFKKQTSEDGVSCLLSKIQDSVKYEFDRWEVMHDFSYSFLLDSDYSRYYSRKSGDVKVQIGFKIILFAFLRCKGEIKIDETTFKLTHKECKQFLWVWKDAVNAKNNLKKQEVLEKWGCK